MNRIFRQASLWALAALLSGYALAQGPRRIEDNMAERTRACTACHGDQGRAGPDGYYPRLAGKPAGYLHNQLRNFAQGRRHYGLMSRLVEPLDDAYMAEIAAHFASLSLPYPPPAPSKLPAALLARGEALVLRGDAQRGLPACVQCHGEKLTGVQPHVPGLLGLPLDYLNAQLGAWQTGQRRAQAPDCMAQILQRLPHEDIIAVSNWLASQALPTDTRPAPAPRQALLRDARWRCGSAPELTGGQP
jgi:cytochrome c553